MSKHKTGIPRTQTALLPPTLDDYAAANSIVRVIDSYVASLDLAVTGFSHAIPARTGASSYAAAELLKLYLYGYWNRITHSRQLATECKRNVEVMWLMGQLTPCFKTIAAFRSANAQAFEAACAHFVEFVHEIQLVSRKSPVVAIDGSKFKASAAKRSILTPEQLERERQRIQKRIRRYLEEMDEADQQDEGVPELTPEQVEAALEKLKQRDKQLEQAQAELAERTAAALPDETQTLRASLTDPDAVLLTGNGGQTLAGYNVQQAVDAQHGIIIAHKVTTLRNDHTSLEPMAVQAQQVLHADALTVLSDSGYFNGAQAQACEERGITPVVPMPQPSQTRAAGGYPKTLFSYDLASDTYRCAAGETLTRYKRDRKLQTDYYGTRACERCPLRANCTRSRRRSIARSWFAAAAERANARARSNPRLMRLRGATAEHPFGNLKAMLKGGFCVRTLVKVSGEMALAVLTYNLKRSVNVLGIDGFLEKLWMRSVWRAAEA
jgi:transposase